MVAPDTGVRTAASLPTPTRRSRGTVRSHPRVRITGSSYGMRVAVNIVARYVSSRRRHQPPLWNGVVNRNFYLSYGFLCFHVPAGVTYLKKLAQSYIETLQYRSQYSLPATHPTLTKSTKPFILGYSVIAIVLHFSVPGKACLSVCSVTLLTYLLFLKLCYC